MRLVCVLVGGALGGGTARRRFSRESCGGVGRIDGVFMRPRRRDAVDAAA